ncbi:MAG: hypothetical protein K2P92_05750 [Bdellovibrionaceae bacterium]|nr:hypothetical protein [Pseudobdellovibrionaceae bacterium]
MTNRITIKKLVSKLQNFADRVWYAPIVSILAALDNIILIVPTDGLVISSSMLRPKRWLYFSFIIAVGSTLGALFLALLIEEQGLPTLLKYYPNLDQTRTWALVDDFFQKYGLLCVFVVSALPVMQQPAVVLASLALTPYYKLGLVIFAGRFLKFMLFAYIGSHAPKLLPKIWGLQDELARVNKDVT